MKALQFFFTISFFRAILWALLIFSEPLQANQSAVLRHRQVLIMLAVCENFLWLGLHLILGWEQGQLSSEKVLEFVESYALYRAATIMLTRWIARPISAVRRCKLVHGSIVERFGRFYKLECERTCLFERAIPEYVKHGNVSPSGWAQYDEMAALSWDRFVAHSIKCAMEERNLANGYAKDHVEVLITPLSNSEHGGKKGTTFHTTSYLNDC